MSSRDRDRFNNRHPNRYDEYDRDRWNSRNPGRNTAGNSGRDSNSLGTTAIVFISVGGAIVLIVFITCIIIWIRSSRRKPDRRVPVQVVGRAIQRPSFLPFRSFRRYNEPEIVYYPSPEGSSINYPILTPYTFPSTITVSSTGTGSPKSVRSNKFVDSSTNTSVIPTKRTTVL